MRVLVTGGNGLVGSALLSLLLAEDHQITMFDRYFDSAYIDDEDKAKIHFIKGDLISFEHILNAVITSQAEVIYHLGSMLSVPSEEDPQTSFKVNGNAFYHLLEAARLFRVRQVIYTSTVTTYGSGLQSSTVDDFTLQRPTTMYGITKLLAESLGRYYKQKYGIDFRAVRYSALVGPGAKTKHIGVYNSWMIEKSFLGEPYEIFVTPERKTTLIYYKDAASYLIKLAKAPIEDIKTICYNLPGHEVTAQELADYVIKIIPNAKLTFKPDEKIMKIFREKGYLEYDGSSAENEWGCRPEYSLEEMIKDFGEEIEKMKSRKS